MDEERYYDYCYSTFNSIYDNLRHAFRDAVYRKYHNYLERNNTNDKLIDDAIKYRAGISLVKPYSINKTVEQVLEELIYGAAIDNNVINEFKRQCDIKGVPSACVADNLKHSSEQRYSHIGTIDRRMLKEVVKSIKKPLRYK